MKNEDKTEVEQLREEIEVLKKDLDRLRFVYEHLQSFYARLLGRAYQPKGDEDASGD